ncbi:MAG: recombinase family protein [Bacillota bacterium]
MKVAVYCRVSTDDQADSKTIENQVDFARGYCQLHGLNIYDFYLDEGVSGTIPVENRPAGKRLLADALYGCFGAVYVYRLDRLARTTLDILRTHQRLSEAGVALRSMTENFDTSTPSGKFFMTTLGGIAEIERETIAERMRLGKARALREGRWPGGPPPYGYSLADKRLAVNKKEAAVVAMIFRMYTRGEMSTGLIADYLNAIGVPPPGLSGGRAIRGRNRWHGSRIWSILSNPAYRGTFQFGRRGQSVVELECPPIVSTREWEEARAIRRKNSYEARRNSKRQYLLKGLIKCGLCGRTYCGDGSGRDGRLCYYRCPGSTSARGGLPKCPSRSVRADLIEDMVWGDVLRFVLNSRQALAVAKGGGALLPGKNSSGDERELELIEKVVRSKERERKRVIGLFRREIISEREAGEELANITRELEALNKRRSAICDRARMPRYGAEIKDDLHRRLESAAGLEKRDLLGGLVDGIIVDTVAYRGKTVPRVTISYVFAGTDCALIVETRGKYRLGVPKSPY